MGYNCGDPGGNPAKKDIPERGGHRSDGLKLSQVISCSVSILSCGAGQRSSWTACLVSQWFQTHHQRESGELNAP